MRARGPYGHDEVGAADVVRPLDPTEHNTERMNRLGFGAASVYQTARVRGHLERGAVEAAVRGLARHAAVRVRVVRGPDGLAFADGDVWPEVRWIDLDASEWPAFVEADMNDGPLPTHRGSAFRVFVIGRGDDHAITLAAAHHVWDGVSAVALMIELLEQIARPHARPRAPLRAVVSPFVAAATPAQRGRLEELARAVAAWASAEDAPEEGRAALCASLEDLEGELLEMGDDSARPRELLEVQRLLVDVDRSRRSTQTVVPEGDPGLPPARAGRVTTGLFQEVIGPEIMRPLAAEARRRGLTLNGAFGGAMLLANAARHWGLTGTPDARQVFTIASPVSLRRQFHPPLADDDVRMAAEPAFTLVPIGPADPFWDVAARYGASVTRDVGRRRILGAWFRTEPRAPETPLAGVPLPLVSNVGRVAAATRYGGLDLVELHCSMTTHSMFQIAMLIQTLGDAANICYYHELPTVSRASMRQVARAIRDTLELAAGGRQMGGA